MQKLLFLPLLFICLSMTQQKKTKIVFFGDSITQQGNNKNGYIDRMRTEITTKNIRDKYELVGAGIGGNKVYDLYLRMEEDVLSKEPDVVVIYVGINDVWHKSSSGTGTDKAKFEKFYIAIIKKLQAKNIRVVLCTPTVIGELKNNTNQQDGDLNAYSEIIRRIAVENDCGLIDLRNAFLEYENANNAENKESGILTTDRVHLNENGNKLVAAEMMKALGIK
jgi:isoamyl acetate esterase